MSVYVYRSTDADAPVLTGEVGTLVSLLDACLVNGYGSVAISSMTRSGSTVTVTTGTVHGLAAIGDESPTVTISGADQTDYNGRWKVTAVNSSDEFEFDIGVLEPVTPATGSMTAKRSSAGWGKPYNGTHIGVYRAPAGNQHYLQAIDSGLSSARSARIRGYVDMSAHDAGTEPFPTVAQVSTSHAVYKSSTTDSTARPWVLVADDRLVYLFTDAESTSGVIFGHAFGEIDAFNDTDAYHTIIIGCDESTSTSTLDNTDFAACVTTLTTQSRHHVARDYTNTGTSAAFGKMGGYLTGTLMGSSGMSYPAPVDNGVYMEPIRVTETGTFRGVMPGLYAPMHNKPLSHLTAFGDVLGLPGRTLLAIDLANTAGSSGAQCLIDITGPWR